MNTNELFIKASQIKLRFSSPRGLLTVEDLWDLPLKSATGKPNLDQLAINAFNGIEATPTVSFVSEVPAGDSTEELRLEIIKHVISVKQAAAKAKLEASSKAEEKRKLLALIQRKQENALESLSEEDLIKRLEAL